MRQVQTTVYIFQENLQAYIMLTDDGRELNYESLTQDMAQLGSLITLLLRRCGTTGSTKTV